MKDVIISELKQKYGEEMTAKMFAYMGKILAANEHINLTAVREEDEFLEFWIRSPVMIAMNSRLLRLL